VTVQGDHCALAGAQPLLLLLLLQGAHEIVEGGHRCSALPLLFNSKLLTPLLLLLLLLLLFCCSVRVRSSR
jgi:hypothetical protein